MTFAYLYADLEEFKRELKLSPDDSYDEDVLLEKLDDATAVISRLTHRDFAVSADETRYIDCAVPAVLGRSLFLEWDLCEIATITSDGVDIPLSDIVPTPRLHSMDGGRMSAPTASGIPDAWPFYELILKNSAAVPYWTYTNDPIASIEITGRWGFSTSPPPDIVAATLRLASHFYSLRDTGERAEKILVGDTGAVFVPSGIPESVMTRIRPYIRH